MSCGYYEWNVIELLEFGYTPHQVLIKVNGTWWNLNSKYPNMSSCDRCSRIWLVLFHLSWAAWNLFHIYIVLASAVNFIRFCILNLELPFSLYFLLHFAASVFLNSILWFPSCRDGVPAWDIASLQNHQLGPPLSCKAVFKMGNLWRTVLPSVNFPWVSTCSYISAFK